MATKRRRAHVKLHAKTGANGKRINVVLAGTWPRNFLGMGWCLDFLLIPLLGGCDELYCRRVHRQHSNGQHQQQNCNHHSGEGD